MTHKDIAGRRAGPVALLALALVAVLGLAACGGTESGDNDRESDRPPAAAVVAQPADGSTGVAPAEPARVSITDGTIQQVALTNPDGKAVEGQLSEDKRSWATTEPLGYGKTYTWSGTAVDADGGTVPIAGSFTTVTPRQQLRATANVGDHETYGVAMPVAITFRDGANNAVPVKNKAAVEKALSVTATPNTEGSWAWLHNDTSVHWRPKEYWQPHTEVHVEAKLYGVELADGVYGKNDLTVDFTIGRSQIVKGNTQTHRMVVIRDGKQVADYPVSYGLDSDPGRVTRSGVHVVMSKHPTYFMNNPGYGYEDFEVQWAVRISNNGEFTHAAPWSVGDQGRRNVSHGCLNLAPRNAKEYFDSAMVGDPVEIEGSSQRLGPKDGDYLDWTYSWQEWTAMSALNG
ncbi:Lipoprotein-anchoring transpeptidase ErfK/SrfK [Amycolatopsis arida]|uniref:Lipoprotein-anchoring transpeptidase ErfK/SrfK n=1 Tax=Amycolatopsis arida TaxID=587909 RepID=A0A1I5SM14_9PSEU|nr:Ig-like domain-containing protein [Amycolatopsis arida]TDX96444.1 lipoprotein-anchoring transpeptidase ErfK/SrfK [Amycolatopsis arida]SFP71356.1 Lipoprotein-anchoring transpeptidase ErfK/SrfK [Amycolatopsis arida]